MNEVSPVMNALEAADLRVLVMCLYHLTGDERWIEPPYRPTRDVNLIADPTAGFDAATAAEIRAAIGGLLADGVPDLVVDDPGPERFQELLSIYLGEPVPDEYVAWIRQDMGLDDAEAHWRTDAGHERAERLDVVIIGAGFSGLGLAAKLDGLGIEHTVIEKNADVGGTWFENRYPGCGVDTPNHFYQYSFAQNSGWEHYFSPRDEIFDYVSRFADDAGVRPRLRTSTRVTSARWDDTTARWTIACQPADGDPYELSAAIVVAATGHFNSPITNPFAGIDTFEGTVLHTAQWPAEPVDLAGQHVAVIGTGASSMQLVPTIVDEVGHLTVFQRTPQWVRPTPGYNDSVDPASRWLFEHLPWYGRWYRFGQMWRYGDGLLRYLRRDPDWEHPDRAMNRVNDRHREEMDEFIRSELADQPDLIEHCIPSYPPFGKRILLDNDWYKTLRRDDVSLVPKAVDRIAPTGVVDVDGDLHDVDVVVLATGFDITDLTAHMDVIGRGGLRLADDWADRNPTAYLGMTVPGFPNLFVMYGPNTNMGHGGSGIWLGETQTRYICDRLVDMAERDLATIEVRDAERRAYTDRVDALHDELVWAHAGTPTYYRTEHGKVRSPMPFRLVDYWTMCVDADLEPFDVTARS